LTLARAGCIRRRRTERPAQDPKTIQEPKAVQDPKVSKLRSSEIAEVAWCLDISEFSLVSGRSSGADIDAVRQTRDRDGLDEHSGRR
jgi:hypothetical protein